MSKNWQRALMGLGLFVTLSFALVMGTQTAASARAELITSSPENGATVATAPKEVIIRFSEDISLSFGGLVVVDAKGDPVDDGEPGHGATNDTLRVGLIDGLGDGTYVANYRVASQDGQPLAGAILFTVGKDTAGSSSDTGSIFEDTTALERQTSSNRFLHVSAGFFRFVTYLGALIAAGLAAFLAFIHDQRRDRWKLAPPIRIASIIAAFGAIGTVVMEAALVSGRGLVGAGNAAILRDVLGDGLGWSTAILLVGLALVHLSTDTNRLLVAQTLSFYGALMVTSSFALFGHSYAATNQSLAIISDAIHVTAAAIWLGGLIGLSWTIISRLGSRGDNQSDQSSETATVSGTARIISRFSTIAAISLVILLVSGGVLSATQLRGGSMLFTSSYGRLLLAKILVVVFVCAIAAYNRFRLLPIATQEPANNVDETDTGVSPSDTDPNTLATTELDGPDVDVLIDRSADPQLVKTQTAWRRLVATTKVEAVALVVVLAVTSALVVVTPPRAPRTGPRIFNEMAELSRGGYVTMNINPNRVGPNTIHIQYYNAAGEADRDVTDAQIEFLFPQNGIGPIVRKALRGGRGHFIYQGTELSIPGEWQVNVLAQISPFDQERTYYVVDVSK